MVMLSFYCLIGKQENIFSPKIFKLRYRRNGLNIKQTNLNKSEQMNRKTYQISVVCSDATTHCAKITTKTRAEAEQFCNGVKSLLTAQGKNVLIETVKPSKNY